MVDGDRGTGITRRRRLEDLRDGFLMLVIPDLAVSVESKAAALQEMGKFLQGGLGHGAVGGALRLIEVGNSVLEVLLELEGIVPPDEHSGPVFLELDGTRLEPFPVSREPLDAHSSILTF